MQQPATLYRPFASLLTLSIAWSSGMLAARADVFELPGGGRVEGRLVEPADADDSVYVIELSAGGRLTIPRAQVARIHAATDDEAEYQELVRTSPDTVEAHWKLVEWCRERKMRSRSHEHLNRILELDPNHAEARAALGFRLQDGQWVTRDEVMEARGMVRYEGRYVTPQHVALLERQKETRSSQVDWANRLNLLRRWLTGRREDRTREALAEIRAIDDPHAAEAIVNLLRREREPELKRLWLDAAGRLDHPRTIDALVDLSLYDDELEIRRDALEHLIQANRPGLVKPYIRALKHADNEIVNRAGAALGLIGDAAAAGPLIDALITKHRFQVESGSAGQHAHSFSPDGGGGFSFGGGGPRFETLPVRNPAVLSALVTLTGGVSFDYDQQQWRRWLAAQAKEHTIDLRRD